MKLTLIAAIAASACVAASVSPTFAQDTTPVEDAIRGGVVRAERPARTIVRREKAAVVPDANVIAAPAPAIVTARAAVAAPVAAGGRPYDHMIASHAASNGVPAELVHRVVVRESRYRANARGLGGATGLMQIKLATARSMGYRGSAAGLLDPETNLTYGVRYLAGAYRAARGNHGRAVGYYASGYRGAARPASAYARMQTEPTIFTAASAEPAVEVERKVRRKRR
jgi:soluble lytic murein transglycosylase-like protein